MNNFGPRMIVNILSGAVCCYLWVQLATPAHFRWSERAAWCGLIAWGMAILYVGSYIATPLRLRLRLPYLLPLAAVLSGWLYFVVGSEEGREQARLISRLALIPATLLAGPLLVCSAKNRFWRNRWFRETFRFGDGDNAEWATRIDYNEREVRLPKLKNGKLGWLDRVYLGSTTFRHDVSPRHIGLKTDVHLCTVGMSGSGKSATVAWINYALYGGAAFIVDMKAEHAKRTARRRSQLGPVYICDPLGVLQKEKGDENGSI